MHYVPGFSVRLLAQGHTVRKQVKMPSSVLLATLLPCLRWVMFPHCPSSWLLVLEACCCARALLGMQLNPARRICSGHGEPPAAPDPTTVVVSRPAFTPQKERWKRKVSGEENLTCSHVTSCTDQSSCFTDTGHSGCGFRRALRHTL